MQRQAVFGASNHPVLLRLGARVAGGVGVEATFIRLGTHIRRGPGSILLHRSKRRILTRAKPVIGEYRLKGRRAVDNVHRYLAIAALMAAWLSAGASAMAQDSSPYVVGHWRLNDSFADFTPGAHITTDNTDFVFLNPTNLTLTLEYAFFAAPDGTFCGCDRDTLKPNGRTRYTMLGEQQGKLFSTTLCPTQTEGVLKSIVFTGLDKKGNIVVDDALQAGVQSHIFGSQRSESNLQGVTVNDATKKEMNQIHQQCVGFLGP